MRNFYTIDRNMKKKARRRNSLRERESTKEGSLAEIKIIVDTERKRHCYRRYKIMRRANHRKEGKRGTERTRETN